MKTETIDINLLKPNPINPRTITNEAMDNLKKSIRELPEMLELRPIVVDDDNVVLGGNQRLKALQSLGYKKATIIRADNLTDKQKKEFLLKDNGNFGEFDIDKLVLDFDEFDLGDFGLGELDLDLGLDEPQGITEADDIPEPPKEPKSKLGEIYQLGSHRIMCGDSTSQDDVEKLMDGAKADMVFTDPPYGMKKEKDGVLNDNLNHNDLLEFNKKWIPLSFDNLKENGSWYCWGIDEPLMDIYSAILKPKIAKQKATFRNIITWDKGHGQGQNSDNTRSYATADEKCLFVMCGVQGFNNNADNYFEGWEPIRDYLLEQRKMAGWDVPKMKQIAGHSDLRRDHWTCKSQWNMPTEKVYKTFQDHCQQNNIEAFKKEYDELKKEYDELKKEYYSTRAYFNNTHDNFNNVWHFDRHTRDGSEGDHATPKPIELCKRAIITSSREKEMTLDMFLGSGSTLIACENTNRVCYGMELDPVYIDVIIKRWEDYTGQIATKVSK